MSGLYTYTVDPTPEIIAQGLIQHASGPLAALVFLAGLLFGSRILEGEPP